MASWRLPTRKGVPLVTSDRYLDFYPLRGQPLGRAILISYQPLVDRRDFLCSLYNDLSEYSPVANMEIPSSPVGDHSGRATLISSSCCAIDYSSVSSSCSGSICFTICTTTAKRRAKLGSFTREVFLFTLSASIFFALAALTKVITTGWPPIARTLFAVFTVFTVCVVILLAAGSIAATTISGLVRFTGFSKHRNMKNVGILQEYMCKPMD
uniref:Uncharacterized protein n=1 Tax=Oryza meridionalis TaxID=40149 RepID=A0A0E0E826_9ORYZ